jgi:hypothetical protein
MNYRITVHSVIVAMFVGLLLFSANARSQIDRAEWTEEVQLANGDTVVVKRAASRDQKRTPVTRRGPFRTWEVNFPDGRVNWTSHGSTRPLSIEIVDGSAYIAVDIRSRELCAKYENPSGSVVFFRWDKNAWVRIPREEYPRGGKVNLLQDPWGRTSKDDIRGLVKHHDKHLQRGEQLVGIPIDQLVADRSRDACEQYKKI